MPYNLRYHHVGSIYTHYEIIVANNLRNVNINLEYYLVFKNIIDLNEFI